ncbi:MAG TPA: sugar phosphate nucleotidyltransferase [Candidatus Polarisedimenticolaceae bacterium]|nr:sugar phosphate nucleotidyltransferase [Candidatus Polarisedimenticolaceae bacterium]
MTLAVIMAGGRSARMRATAGPVHKALVPVLGVALLERNLCALLAQGFRDVAVAVSAHEPDVERWVLGRGRALATAVKARLECLRERSARGTIGAVAGLEASGRSLLVVNVDNLTALPLAKLVAAHEAAGAAMTIASHVETMRAPCGELRVVDGMVTDYLEKPVTRFPASSGTYVLGAKAVALLDDERRWDVPDLVTALIARGDHVCAFPHEAPWIDVNDAAARAHAERLLAEQRDSFEHWGEPPAHEVVALLMLSASRALVAHRPARSARYRGSWDVPGDELRRDGATPSDALGRLLAHTVPGSRLAPKFLTSLDDLDVTTGRLIRHHVFVAHAEDVPSLSEDSSVRWVSRKGLPRLGSLSSPLVRALAWADRST